jgi:hypothetical protein
MLCNGPRLNLHKALFSGPVRLSLQTLKPDILDRFFGAVIQKLDEKWSNPQLEMGSSATHPSDVLTLQCVSLH